ncbi:MAG: hypothetical protein AAGB51_09550 [Planctomycetota bacterium]
MFAKLCVLIVVAGATASGLLAMRQSRIQARSELAAAHLEIARIERKLQDLRAGIASGVTPDRVQELLARSGAAPGDAILEPIIRQGNPLTVRETGPTLATRAVGQSQ